MRLVFILEFLGFILFYSSPDHMNRENLLKPWNISFSSKLEFLDEFSFNLCNKDADFLIKKILPTSVLYLSWTHEEKNLDWIIFSILVTSICYLDTALTQNSHENHPRRQYMSSSSQPMLKLCNPPPNIHSWSGTHPNLILINAFSYVLTVDLWGLKSTAIMIWLSWFLEHRL